MRSASQRFCLTVATVTAALAAAQQEIGAAGKASGKPALTPLAQAQLYAINGNVHAIDALCKNADEKDKARLLEAKAIAHHYVRTINNSCQIIAQAARIAPHDEHIMVSRILMCTYSHAIALNNLATAEKLVSESPKEARRYVALALCYQYRGDSKAEATLDRAVALAPSDFEVNFFAGHIYRTIAKLGKAQAAYDRLVKNYPKSAVAYLARGLFEGDQFDTVKAAADLRKVAQLNKEAVPTGQMAKTLSRDGSYSEAIVMWTDLIKKGEGSSPYARRADCYAHLKRFPEAISDYDHAIKLLGTNHSVTEFDRNGMLLLNQANRESYKKYWLRRTDCKEEMHHLDEALNEATQFVKALPTNLSGLDQRQRLRFKTGDYKGAIADLNRLIKLNRFDAELYEHRAAAYEKLGDKEAAAADRERVENIEKTGSTD